MYIIKHSFLVYIFLILALFLIIDNHSLADLRKVSFLTHWVPQAQFAGYYVALEKGFYRQRGLDVTILSGGPEIPTLMWLEERKTTFVSTFLANAIIERSKGAPLVNIAQLVQRSGLLLVAKKDSGIKTPADFDNKRISLWRGFRVQPLALFHKFKVRPRIIHQGTSLNLFLRGGVDLVSAMIYNELHTIINSGYDENDLVVFRYNDYGLNFPEDGIYCLESTLRNDQSTCHDFVIASLEGWRYALDHFEETIDIVMKYVRAANLGMTRVHQIWMLSHILNLIFIEDATAELGVLSERDYKSVVKELHSAGLIDNMPLFNNFYENCAKE